MRNLFAVVVALVTLSLHATTVHNDDSCDIGAFPAATLLLPNFQVDIGADRAHAADTLFTVANVSRTPQIARATVWTDLGYPLLTFNIFLGGYDVQSYSMYDLLSRGAIEKTSIEGGHGSRSLPHHANAHFADDVADTCARLAQNIPSSLLADVQSALTVGRGHSCTQPIGLTHYYAIGYVTIDLVANCTGRSPMDDGYFEHDLLFDNVLTGDYERIIEGTTSDPIHAISGTPLVHIRAIPEGGPVGQPGEVAFPVTFYDRLAPASNRSIDRRQPLPSLFAARFISISPEQIETRLSMWHEPVARPLCDPHQLRNFSRIMETVRFDEHENPTAFELICRIDPCLPLFPTLPVSSSLSVDTSGFFPPDVDATNDAGGWLYLNLSTTADELGATATRRTTQNWVTVEITRPQHDAVIFDATQLGNGCTPNPGLTTSDNPIGPAKNTNERSPY